MNNISTKVLNKPNQSNKINTLTQLFILTIITLFSFTSFADSVDNRLKMVSAIYNLITYFAYAMGIFLMILGGVKLKQYGDNQNAKTGINTVIITFFVGAMIFNYSGSASMMITSLLGENSGYCFVVEDASKLDLHKDKCFDASSSEIFGGLTEKVNEMSEGSGNFFEKNITSIFGFFQMIGLIYFIKGLYNLKTISEGRKNDSYLMPIITIVVSALIIDLPHSIELVKETVEALGLGS